MEWTAAIMPPSNGDSSDTHACLRLQSDSPGTKAELALNTKMNLFAEPRAFENFQVDLVMTKQVSR